MPDRRLTAVVLAAGEGTRMRSARPKVLHEVAGRTMLGHVLEAALGAGASRLALVVGPDRDDVAAAGRAAAPGAEVFTQAERRGTAHAVLAARPALADGADLVVLFGDTPLVTADAVRRLAGALGDGAAVAVAGFEAADPAGYGRVLLQGGRPVAIREEKDASAAERAVTLCNGGLMALAGAHALDLLDAVGCDNAKGEFYLTDVVALAAGRGLPTALVEIAEAEVQGVNDRAQLAAAEAAMQARLRAAALAGGATLVAPETVFLSADTRLAADAWVGPHVVFGPGVTVEGGAEIHAFSHLAGCTVEAGARVGPFARIRPKSRIGAGAHVGNFVEVNRTSLGPKVEANHLAYLGDAEVGEGTNVGAGTITCNFDGADKHKTRIGRDVFVGSNATLVAPLAIGDEALVAAGSTLTRDVEAGALAFGRAQQADKPGRAAERIRANKVRRAERKARGG
jgi:bifunctional UDP-N-acetylglucosamine pyrophosphorylase/glucosamine-1-phosphate N-acetyltransferase